MVDSPPQSRRGSHALLAALMLGYAALYTALSWLRLRSFHAQIDMSFYLRLCWGLSQGRVDLPLVQAQHFLGLHLEPVLFRRAGPAGGAAGAAAAAGAGDRGGALRLAGLPPGVPRPAALVEQEKPRFWPRWAARRWRCSTPRSRCRPSSTSTR